jgi:hypothetical protein
VPALQDERTFFRPLFVLNTQDARPELSKDLERVIDLGVGPEVGRRRLTIMAGSAG